MVSARAPSTQRLIQCECTAWLSHPPVAGRASGHQTAAYNPLAASAPCAALHVVVANQGAAARPNPQYRTQRVADLQVTYLEPTPAQAELVHAVAEGVAGDAEEFGGARDVAAGVA